MSKPVKVYPCLHAPKWEVYPRVFFFRKRILDFYNRFKSIVDRFPEIIPRVLHDESLFRRLQDFTDIFKSRSLRIFVIGRENLTTENIFVSPEALDRPTMNVEGSYLDIVICYVTVRKFDHSGTEEIVQTINHFVDAKIKEEIHFLDVFVVMVKTETTFTDDESETFRQNVLSETPLSARLLLSSIENIVISTDLEGLKHHISKQFEARIVHAFVNMRTYLSLFVPDPVLHQPIKVELLHDRHVTKALQGFLRNGFVQSDLTCGSSDKKSFLSKLRKQIARVVKCMVIVPMSLKYTLSSWSCNRLLNDIQFEDALVKSVSKQTNAHLTKLHSFAIRCKNIVLKVREEHAILIQDDLGLSRCNEYDFILKHLQNDFRVATNEAEKKVSRWSENRTILRKLIFEVDGYLKQTVVKHESIQHRESTVQIPENLRRDIMSLKGVYGMGTVYGILEVHLDEKDDTIADLIKSLIHTHRFPNTFNIKAWNIKKA